MNKYNRSRYIVLIGYFSLPMLFMLEDSEFMPNSFGVMFLLCFNIIALALDFANGYEFAFDNILVNTCLKVGRFLAFLMVCYFLWQRFLDLLVDLGLMRLKVRIGFW
jgi:hypothetical protein